MTRIFSAAESEEQGREAMVALGQLLYKRGLIASTDGNFSIRLGQDRILITPGAKAKGRLQASELVVVSSQGDVMAAGPGLRPSSETPMHLEAYRQREDIGAVIHAHPPYALALTVAGRGIRSDVLPEVKMTLGEVPTLPFAAPSSEEGATAIRSAIQNHDALLLKNHGSLTVGPSLEDALVALERIEAVAQVIFLAELLGQVDHLSTEQLQGLG